MAGKARSERGATAVLVALLAIVLFIAGAIAMDMGQVYAKRSALQSNVDMAVLAAAAEIDGSNSCTPEAVAVAEDYLTREGNEVDGQMAVDLGGTEGDDSGFIKCTGWRVELWAPKARTDFGMGQITGNAGVDVPAFAAAEIKSPSANFGLPFFAVDGCDKGQQIIRDATGRGDPQPVPPLTPNSVTVNDAELVSLLPDTAATGTPSLSVTVFGSNLADADAVAFTGAGGPPDHHEVPEADFTSVTATQIELEVPPEVLAIDDVWFVRVLKGADWSDNQEALRFTVGEPRLYCANSVDGNFGTLDIPRTGTPFDLEWNMILGIQPTLAIHPAPAGECGGDPAPTVESTTTPVNGTNCIASEPGIKIAAANDGLVQGKGGLDGRLDRDTTGNCSRNDDGQRTPTAFKGGVYLNDDLLTCFIINSARINDLVLGNTAGTQALSADIFNSPRYFWIPVVSIEPFAGTKSWPIVGFRPGFITDQPLSGSNAFPGTVSEFNGLIADSRGLIQLTVVLFDEKALPEFAPAVGGEVDYTGSGPKVIVLVD